MGYPNWFRYAALAIVVAFMTVDALADDTCVFSTTADDIPPNIVILLDNGAAMEEIARHASYDNATSYTPSGCADVVQNAPGGIGFCRDKGYAITVSGINIFRMVNGLAVEQWALIDDLGMMQQLGLIPAQQA